MPKNSQNRDQNQHQNPVIKGNFADPSVIRVGEDYYMTHSSYRSLPGLIIWHSKDLVHWLPIGSALFEFDGDVWAPELIFYDGLFYIYFPANRTNWVTTAKEPSGPWSKPVDLQTSLIDPGHVVGPDGKRYLHLSGGHMVQLADDGLSVVGELRHVYEPWRYPDDWVVEAFSPEGPKLTKHGEYYYLTLAVGGTSGPPTSHMVTCSRSRTPWGPWEHSPCNPIIRTQSRNEKWWSTGHGTLVDTPDGKWWMVFHGYANGLHTIGRQTLLLPIEWTEDDWYLIKDGILPEEPIALAAYRAESNGFALQDDFANETLGLHWHCYGINPKLRFYPNDGELIAEAKGSEGNPLCPLLYRGTGDRVYEAEIEVSVESGAEAMLLLYYNEEAFFGVGASHSGIRFFRSFKSYSKKPHEGGWIGLRVRNEDNIVTFYYRQHGSEDWIQYDKVTDASGLHHNTFGKFLSLQVGVDAVGEGTVKFRRFRYRPIVSV